MLLVPVEACGGVIMAITIPIALRPWRCGAEETPTGAQLLRMEEIWAAPATLPVADMGPQGAKQVVQPLLLIAPSPT